jgi:hypothetical protein
MAMANKQTIKQAKSSIKTDPGPADEPARKRERETRRRNPRARSRSAAAQIDAVAALPEVVPIAAMGRETFLKRSIRRVHVPSRYWAIWERPVCPVLIDRQRAQSVRC